ncbi:MAG: hypothetical protein ACRC5B_05245, partial [Fusobacteriaceae bacterium]
MRKIIYLIILMMLSTLTFSDSSIKKKYRSLKLEGKIDYKNFEKAMQGYKKINNKKNESLIAIIDYTKPS